MARRRHHRRRSYRSYVNIPGLGNFKAFNFLKSNVNAMDVLVGVVAGLVGSGLVKMALAKANVKLPDAVQPYQTALGSVAAGSGLYFAQKKSGRATGHLIGAMAGGLALTAWDMLTKYNPGGMFSDVVALPMGRYGYPYGGVVVDERTPGVGPGAYGGLVVDEPGRALSDYNLSELANLSMGEERSGMEDLMEMD